MKRLFLGSFASVCAVVVACSSTTTVAPTTTAGTDAGGDSGAPDDAGTSAGTQCTAQRAQLLGPIKSASTAEVSVVSDDGTTKLIYVDASTGGNANNESKSPRVYVDLADGTNVGIDDDAAYTSTGWDLALRRAVLYSNSGDAGIGIGGAAQLDKAFDAVTAADADAAKIRSETFFDGDCNPQTDIVGQPATIFSDWYDYDQATNIVTPKPNVTFIVVGGQGKRYKVAIKSYAALPDGGARGSSVQTMGYYLLQVAAL